MGAHREITDGMVLRPDPAEYIEDFGYGPIRSVDVLTGALCNAAAHGVTASEIAQAAIEAESIRDFDRIISGIVDGRAAA